MHGSLQNQLLSNAKSKSPEVGDGATEVMYTDRFPYTVIAVKDPKHITVQEDEAIRIDKRGMTDAQSYEYHPNPEGRTCELSLRKNGKWIEVGQRANATPFVVGTRQRYHDYTY